MFAGVDVKFDSGRPWFESNSTKCELKSIFEQKMLHHCLVVCSCSFIVMLVIEPYNFSFSEIFSFFLLFMYEIACLAR